ncbi:hypothetical protein HYH03_018748 [Edaphochlamys debaryana]|uniref:Uncharacterized protein n=1 Tax=Edaphochlamys debaryana TaxID=47281 RepID=A0A836BMM5_9CHLO|nr:hypothetical protein HYH03_018748 [Edaphochlamys debaryana]|eukprot:KAG2482306.1 hypothetical protein HYH03_018748 [Edaphochlamys debaryana]
MPKPPSPPPRPPSPPSPPPPPSRPPPPPSPPPASPPAARPAPPARLLPSPLSARPTSPPAANATAAVAPASPSPGASNATAAAAGPSPSPAAAANATAAVAPVLPSLAAVNTTAALAGPAPAPAASPASAPPQPGPGAAVPAATPAAAAATPPSAGAASTTAPQRRRSLSGPGRRRALRELPHKLTPMASNTSYEELPDVKQLLIKLVGTIPVLTHEYTKVLQVPAELADTHVSLHANLPYRDFFQTIYSSWALLPRLATSKYLKQIITSSLLSSLSTHVPLVVTDEFLAAYTMLNASTAIRMQPNETVCALYNRIAAMPPPEYGALRRNLRALAEELNTRVLDYIVGQLERTA